MNTRNHNTLKRDDIIKQVANIVGTGHKVDLKNYDLLILIEIYQTSLGMSVVGREYEELKRFNLAEIHAPTPVVATTAQPVSDPPAADNQ